MSARSFREALAEADEIAKTVSGWNSTNEFWYDPSGASATWVRENGAPKPGQSVPGRYGVDFGITSRGGNVFADPQFEPPILPWTCSYCGGKRPSEALRCEGCGASR